MDGFRRVPLGPCVDLSRTLCSSDSCGSSLSRTLCSRNWFRLAVDADRTSEGAKCLVLSIVSKQTILKSLVFWYLFGVQNRAGSRSAAAVCLVLSNTKNQFRAGGPLLYRSSRNCKLCKHVKTLCFGRDFPYRREALKNFDDESPIFEFLLFGTILLKI